MKSDRYENSSVVCKCREESVIGLVASIRRRVLRIKRRLLLCREYHRYYIEEDVAQSEFILQR